MSRRLCHPSDQALAAFKHKMHTFTQISIAGNYAYTYGINDAGQIVGFYTSADGTQHSFFYSGGIYTTIGPPGTSSFAFGINNAIVLAGVPLHQLPNPAAPRRPSMNLLHAFWLGAPKLGLDHPTAQRLSAYLQLVFVGQILGR